MNNSNCFLKTAFIKNYLSLRNVELAFKPLTVLVGPNASGKSNILDALTLLSKMMKSEMLPPIDFIEDKLWAGGAEEMKFKIDTKINDQNALYSVELTSNEDNRISKEKLNINELEVINVENGKGYVKDEDGTNETIYQSKKLALKSAGDYGNKPITNALNKFLKKWKFYNFNPAMIRGDIFDLDDIDKLKRQVSKKIIIRENLKDDGSNLQHILLDWYGNFPDIFKSVKQAFHTYSNFEIGINKKNSDLGFFEGYKEPITINKISDGTIRLLTYIFLKNIPELPPLIAIEEPERNLHPAWLNTLGELLIQLSERSQLIITTHSSQLLDTFAPHNLHENLGVLLLSNVPGKGTEVMNLDEIREDRKGLQNWIDEFGIGSAIFDSEMLKDILLQENVGV